MHESIAVMVSLASGVIGAMAGAFATTWQMRRQRGFERQLDWYERVIGAMHEMAQAIEIACTFHRERADGELLRKVWRGVQSKHLALDTLMQQCPLYGSNAANIVVQNVTRSIEDAADQTEAFDLSTTNNDSLLENVEHLAGKLRKQAQPLALEARYHLRIS